MEKKLRFPIFFKQPIIYWVLFIFLATLIVQYLQGHFVSAMSYTGMSFFDSLGYVVNLMTFSDPGETIPVTMVAKYLVMVVKLSQLGFLIWFIVYIISLRQITTVKEKFSVDAFTKCQTYMEDILVKSNYVNGFFGKLETDINESQKTIDELENKRQELQRLKSIEQDEVKALVSSLGEVVEKELKKTRASSFLNNFLASSLVMLLGYLIGKAIETFIVGIK